MTYHMSLRNAAGPGVVYGGVGALIITFVLAIIQPAGLLYWIAGAWGGGLVLGGVASIAFTRWEENMIAERENHERAIAKGPLTTRSE